MLKLVIFSALVAAVTPAVYSPYGSYRQYPTRASVQPSPVYRPVIAQTYSSQPAGRQIAILRSDFDIAPDGSSYQYAYETENGISAQESGSLVGSGRDAAIVASGSYQYTSPEGVPVQVSYVADANGFHPSGNVLPTSTPQRSIQYNPQVISQYGRNYY